MPRRKKMTDSALARVIEQQITHSTWFESTESQKHFKDSLASYYGTDKPVSTDGNSAARSQDVADMVEAVVSQMMPAFDFDEVAVFDPESAGDVDQARAESIACNVVLRDRNDGYLVLQEALRNALLLRNGILEVAAEERTNVVEQTYGPVGALELQQAMAPTMPGQEVEVLSAEIVDDGSVRATVKRTTTFKRLNIKAVDTTNFLVTRGYTKHNLQDVPMCGERYFATSSELREMGHSQKLVDSLHTFSMDTHTGSQARNRDGEVINWTDHGDKSQRPIECFKLSIKVDVDQDGIAERRDILYAGGTSGGKVLENELAERVPYASGTGFLQSNRWEGMDLYDKLQETEEIKTDALRQWLNNLGYANNAELVVDDSRVNIEDLKARRPGGINRADDVNAVRELEIHDNGESSQMLLHYMDKVRSERGGASLDLQSAELQLAGETAHGIDRQYTSKEQLAQLLTRTLAESLIRQLFWLIHETLRRDMPDRTVLRMGNQFISMQPGTWPYRERIEIVAGMSASERAQRKAALEGTLMQQEKLHASGFGAGILTNVQTYHDTLVDWTRASGMQNARRYWIDPRSPESVKAQQAAQQASQAERDSQKGLQDLIFRSQMAIEAGNNETDLLKKTGDLKLGYFEAILKSAVEELRIGANSPQVDDLQAQGEAKT